MERAGGPAAKPMDAATSPMTAAAGRVHDQQVLAVCHRIQEFAEARTNGQECKMIKAAASDILSGNVPAAAAVAAVWSDLSQCCAPLLVVFAALVGNERALKAFAESCPRVYSSSAARAQTTVDLLYHNLDPYVVAYPALSLQYQSDHPSVYMAQCAKNNLHVLRKLHLAWGTSEMLRILSDDCWFTTHDEHVVRWMIDDLAYPRSSLLKHFLCASWGTDLRHIVPLVDWESEHDVVGHALHLSPQTLLMIAQRPEVDWQAFAAEAIDDCSNECIIAPEDIAKCPGGYIIEGSSAIWWVYFYAYQLTMSVQDTLDHIKHIQGCELWYDDDRIRAEVEKTFVKVHSGDFSDFDI
jgi:hypothetical protein